MSSIGHRDSRTGTYRGVQDESPPYKALRNHPQRRSMVHVRWNDTMKPHARVQNWKEIVFANTSSVAPLSQRII